ncbi:HIT family protein [Gordonia hirsuta DSM 44140 = NBRC 16056]|uniref:HIT family protein n=1 Tax=Gordonia hirsuta DSM 44140 = NBRC 16056 TaxID=1121927 RepID=L7LC44_9ACTN|nr:HIT family protein [Gordonia hirsuta]GAC57647.1 HIT family protein [Gordonia hirsuta DSM 44140 = NBRC 16056]
MSSDCIFCAIVAGTGPADIVYTDEHIVGFLDIRPITVGHTLLVPRTHHTGLADLPAETGARLFAAGQRVAAAAKAALDADGINLALNDGKSAFQTVFHTHLHVVPRHSGDKLQFAKGLLTRRGGDRKSIAAALREELS